MTLPAADDGPTPEVSILIVSYNTRELTLAALDAVQRETGIAHEIIVVDNASTDGSAAAIAGHPASPKLIALDENLGFGRANNLAARHARAPYLLLLNPDTIVLYHAIDSLVAFARRAPQARIWGGRTLFADGSLNASSCWQRITVWNQFCRTSGLAAIRPRSALFNAEAIGGFDRDSERDVDIVSGCFLLIEKKLWRQLGGFDPKFYMYGEEADLCLRARAFGACPRITPAATIVHLGGASERTRAGKMVKLLAAKISLIDRHVPGWQRPAARALVRLWPLTRRVAHASAGFFLCSARHRYAASVWADIWRQREAWRHGYPDAAAPRTTARQAHGSLST